MIEFMSEPRNLKGSRVSGRVPHWERKGPKRLAPSEDIAESMKAETPKKIIFGLRFVIVIFTVIITSAVALWFVLGITILPMMRVGGNIWLVQRAAWVEGQAPKNAIALTLSHPVERTLSSRLALLLSGDTSIRIIEIVASPTDKVATDKSNVLFINGKSTGRISPVKIPVHTLGDSYLVSCIRGACLPSKQFIEVPTNYILGKVLGSVGPSAHLGSVPSALGGTHV
jgi:hypothetical protein